MLFFEIFIIIIFSFYIRKLYSLNKGAGINDDSFNHYYYVTTQKGEPFFNFKFKGALFDTFIGYPRLQHFILSRFPEKHWISIGNFLVIFYDVIQVLLVYAFSKYIFYPHPDGHSLIPFIVAILFSTTPVMFGFSARLIGFSNARTLGNLLFFIQLIIWFFLINYQQYYLIPFAVIIYYLIVISSFFALQATAFLMTGLSIGYASFYPILFLVLSSGMFYFLNIGGAKRVIHFKINHWIWYFRNTKKGTTANKRNSWEVLRILPSALKNDFNYFLDQVFRYITPIMLVVLIPGLALLIFNWNSFGMISNKSYFFEIVFLSLIGAFCFTSIPKFLFLGEAERYMEYGASSIAILSGFYIINGNLSIEIATYFILINISIISFLFLFTKKHLIQKGSLLTNTQKENFSKLNSFFETLNNPRVFTIPIKMARFLAALNIDKSVKFYQRFMGPPNILDGFKDFELDTEATSLELPIRDLEKLKKKYSLTHILIQQKYL